MSLGYRGLEVTKLASRVGEAYPQHGAGWRDLSLHEVNRLEFLARLKNNSDGKREPAN